jgi:lipoprotein signal peptidase
MKRQTLFNLLCAVLIFFFTYTAIDSYLQLENLKIVLSFYTGHNSTIAWVLVTAELLAGVMLFWNKTRKGGLLLSLSLIISGGIVMIRYPRHPNDFGYLFYFLSNKEKWVLMTCMLVISIVCLSLIKKRTGKINAGAGYGESVL